MKLKKLSYFPYLPNSRVEDNKRYKYIRDMMEKNPFSYHRKKNMFSLNDMNYFNSNKIPNSNIDNGKEIIQNNNNYLQNEQEKELLIFQNDHDKYMNLYNNFMQRKTSTIEANAKNYLNFLVQLKKPFQINNTPNKNISNKNLITSRNISYNNIKPLSPTHNSSPQNFFINNTMSLSNEFKGRKHFLQEKKAQSESNIFPLKIEINNNNMNESQKENFIAGKINSKHTDITNPFFYNGIAKEIMRMKQEAMDYNKNESEKKYLKMKNNLRNSNNDLPLSPEKINNPNYYNIGDSSLEINPIINRGHYSMSYSRNHNNFNKQKSNFY